MTQQMTTDTLSGMSPTDHDLYVVHPLDDTPEKKRSAEGLGTIKLTPSVRISLLLLRGYLILVVLLAFYRILTLAEMFGHAHPH